MRERVDEIARRRVPDRERRRVRVADARDDVPVRAARRQRQRAPRREVIEPLLGVELARERDEIVLVGAAAVEEDEGALRLTRRLADERAQLGQRTLQLSRGFGSGVNRGSICARRCS